MKTLKDLALLEYKYEQMEVHIGLMANVVASSISNKFNGEEVDFSYINYVCFAYHKSISNNARIIGAYKTLKRNLNFF